MVAWDSAIALGTPPRSPDMSTTSAASTAISVPVPMAMPTSACASAGRVVDAVANKRQRAVALLQALHGLDLAAGQHFGHHFVDAQLAGNGLGGVAVVAGDHGHLQPQLVQRGNGCGGAGLDRVGHGQHGGQLAIDGGVQRGFAFLAQLRGGLRQTRPRPAPAGA